MYKAVTLAGGIREPLLTCSSFNIMLFSYNTIPFYGIQTVICNEKTILKSFIKF